MGGEDFARGGGEGQGRGVVGPAEALGQVGAVRQGLGGADLEGQAEVGEGLAVEAQTAGALGFGEGERVGVGEFPEACEETVARVLGEEQTAPGIAEEEGGAGAFGQRLGRGRRGEVGLAALFGGLAGGAQGAILATGIARGADLCAEVHHGLVEGGGVAARGDVRGEPVGEGAAGGWLMEVAVEEVAAGEDAGHVAVDHGHGEAETDAGDGGGGVVAHAGEGAEAFDGAGEGAAVLGHEALRGLAKVADAGVVTQPLPGLEEGLILGGGEGRDVREGGEEAGEVGADRLDLRLLEHDFADPDGVGVGMAAPRHGTLARAVPREEVGDPGFHRQR